MEVAALKAKAISLTSLELSALQLDIKEAIIEQITEDKSIDIAKILPKLEQKASITLPENEKTFIVAQVAEVRVALESFVKNSGLIYANLVDYQVALEKEMQKAYSAIQSATDSSDIAPIPIVIDVLTPILNIPPIANAGEDKSVNVETTVVLDASLSADDDNDTLTYRWSMIATPTDSTATLSDTTMQKPYFIPDKIGVYKINLVVNDGTIDSASDEVIINAIVANITPVADAGANQSVTTLSTVTLDGSLSYDEDQDSLSYDWVMTSRPIGSEAHLQNETSKNPTFLADRDGIYKIRLVVNDGIVDSVVASVIVSATTPIVDSNDTTISFSGSVVDGYISGADLCLDVDYSGSCSFSEYSSITATSGVFNFSNITVLKDSMIPLISYGGVDSATSKSYEWEFKTIIDSNSINLTTPVILTPLTDMIATNFLMQPTKTPTTYIKSIADVSKAFALSSITIFQDPMSSVSLFMTSQEIEHTKRVLELVLARNYPRYDVNNRYGVQNKIKEVLITQILESGYSTLNIDRILTTLEIDLNINISDADWLFATSQIAEIRVELADQAIQTYTLPRLQSILESDLESAYLNATYVDVDLNEERLLNSKYDKSDATYDKYACLINSEYKNILQDSNTTTQKSEDTINGLIIKSDIDTITLFYDDLALSKLGEYVIVFQDNYYFSYDKAWVGMDKKIYIQTPQNDDGKYSCYRAVLDSTTASEIKLEKVYRYTDE